MKIAPFLFFIVCLFATVFCENWKVSFNYLNFFSKFSAFFLQEVFLAKAADQKITGVSEQCANDTETWQKSLKMVAELSAECLIEQKCTKEELKTIEDNFYAVER